jgi:hypothetical protein
MQTKEKRRQKKQITKNQVAKIKAQKTWIEKIQPQPWLSDHAGMIGFTRPNSLSKLDKNSELDGIN